MSFGNGAISPVTSLPLCTKYIGERSFQKVEHRSSPKASFSLFLSPFFHFQGHTTTQPVSTPFFFLSLRFSRQRRKERTFNPDSSLAFTAVAREKGKKKKRGWCNDSPVKFFCGERERNGDEKRERCALYFLILLGQARSCSRNNGFTAPV